MTPEGAPVELARRGGRPFEREVAFVSAVSAGRPWCCGNLSPDLVVGTDLASPVATAAGPPSFFDALVPTGLLTADFATPVCFTLLAIGPVCQVASLATPYAEHPRSPSYDWSAVPPQVRKYLQFPLFEQDHLDNSLQHPSDGPARQTF